MDVFWLSLRWLSFKTMRFYGGKLRDAARWVLWNSDGVNQAHSVLGERPAYVGVNGWHDPGRSDGLSKLEFYCATL